MKTNSQTHAPKKKSGIGEKYNDFPYAFIEKASKLYIEDEMDIKNPGEKDSIENSYKNFYKVWRKNFESADPDDVFTHWVARYKS